LRKVIMTTECTTHALLRRNIWFLNKGYLAISIAGCNDRAKLRVSFSNDRSNLPVVGMLGVTLNLTLNLNLEFFGIKYFYGAVLVAWHKINLI
jgi:hypothetical protein